MYTQVNIDDVARARHPRATNQRQLYKQFGVWIQANHETNTDVQASRTSGRAFPRPDARAMEHHIQIKETHWNINKNTTETETNGNDKHKEVKEERKVLLPMQGTLTNNARQLEPQRHAIKLQHQASWVWLNTKAVVPTLHMAVSTDLLKAFQIQCSELWHPGVVGAGRRIHTIPRIDGFSPEALWVMGSDRKVRASESKWPERSEGRRVEHPSDLGDQNLEGFTIQVTERSWGR